MVKDSSELVLLRIECCGALLETARSATSLSDIETEIELKSLILAQIERWRHALHMQVERESGGNPAGRVANG